MREILLRDNISPDCKRKDVSIVENVYQSNSQAICYKHCRYTINTIAKIKNVSNIDELFIKQLSSDMNPKREIYIKRKISKKEGIKILDWKIKGYIFLVYRKFLLKIKYDYDYKIQINLLQTKP